jgi:leucyl-tRNA synthetase
MVTEPPVTLAPSGAAMPHDLSEAARGARHAIHRAIAAVSDDFDGFRFNRGIARIRELTNLLEGFPAADPAAPAVLREGFEAAVRLLAPMMPHLAEELWQQLGHSTMLVDERWPQADPALLVEESVTLAVQVNGKLRGTIDLPRDAAAKAAETAALALPTVVKAMENRKPRKVIVVPNRIVNVVL